MNPGTRRANLFKCLVGLILFIQLAGGSSCSAQSGSDSETKDFKLPSVDGSYMRLSDYQGKKPVLLYFWATWCPACMEVKSQVLRLRKKIDREEMEILAINVGSGDSFERVKRFQQAHPMPWPVLYDEEGKMSSSFGVQGIPLFILFNEEGETVYRDHTPPGSPKRFF